MALQAARRKCRSITLPLMNIVTSGAHKIGRRLITPALLQKRNLITMNVHDRAWVGLVAAVIFIQRFARKIGECGGLRKSAAAVTLRANVDLPFPAQLCQTNDICSGILSYHGFHMLACRPVAA